ncbi:MAG: formyltransferase [Pseudomonadota bacterium]
MSSAIVFAYHNVGVRCLSALLDRGVNISLVLTHEDNPQENIWFDSVAELARIHRIPVITPDNPNTPEIIAQIAALQPDFLFSFYYRSMLATEVLQIPRQGAFNMHGSLLPKYRGRVPVNWAIIKGETETGATLHQMVEKPDAGGIVDQQAISILENDTALDVFNKVTVAAEMVLHRALPALIDGTALLKPQNLSQGSYFGGRKPEDGIIDWHNSAENIHNLVRAVAPPYPGAWTTVAGQKLRFLRTLREKQRDAEKSRPRLYLKNDNIFACCGDGGVLRIIALELDGDRLSPQAFQQLFGLSVELV